MIPGSTIHGMPMPLGYSTVTIEKIVGTSKDNEKIELDFIGGNGEKTLGNALHGVVLWRKADIKITGNRKAPVDPLSPLDAANDDRDHFAQPPSASSSLGLKIG